MRSIQPRGEWGTPIGHSGVSTGDGGAKRPKKRASMKKKQKTEVNGRPHLEIPSPDRNKTLREKERMAKQGKTIRPILSRHKKTRNEHA